MGIFDKSSTDQSSTQQPAQPPAQQRPSTDPFDRVGSSDPSLGGIYPVAGVYPFLYVDVLKMIKSRKGDDCFIAEFDILESNVEARPRGSRMSYAVNFRHDAAPGNVKAFIAAVMNANPDSVDAEASRYACSERNPCHGRLVRLEASDTTTRSGNPFTLCNWQPVPDELQERAEEGRREAGFAPF